MSKRNLRPPRPGLELYHRTVSGAVAQGPSFKTTGMKVHSKGNRRLWYDYHIQLWTLQTVTPAGDQVGDVDHKAVRHLAFKWLNEASV